MPNAQKLSAETTALGLSLVILALVVFGVASCGDEDIFFPGELAPTFPPEATNTATPDDN